jgi:hypothetical protein
MKFWFVAAEQAQFPVSRPCSSIGVTGGGFYAWRGRRTLGDARRAVATLPSLATDKSFETSDGDGGAWFRHWRDAWLGRASPAVGAREARLLHSVPALRTPTLFRKTPDGPTPVASGWTLAASGVLRSGCSWGSSYPDGRRAATSGPTGRPPQLRQLSHGALRCDGIPPVHHIRGH